MMSKTHIAIGTSCALLVSIANPSPANACLAFAGGALGGVMPDVDVISKDKTGDAMQGQIITVLIVAFTIIIDRLFNYGAYQLLGREKNILLGAIILIALYVFGVTRVHRGFTHSILSLIIYSIPITLIYEPILKYFMIGYFSHLLIDLFNKRGIQLFFPLKFKLCLDLCYADGLGNKLLMVLGLIATIILLTKFFVFYV